MDKDVDMAFFPVFNSSFELSMISISFGKDHLFLFRLSVTIIAL